jgi:hypothetical protein
MVLTVMRMLSVKPDSFSQKLKDFFRPQFIALYPQSGRFNFPRNIVN